MNMRFHVNVTRYVELPRHKMAFIQHRRMRFNYSTIDFFANGLSKYAIITRDTFVPLTAQGEKKANPLRTPCLDTFEQFRRYIHHHHHLKSFTIYLKLAFLARFHSYLFSHTFFPILPTHNLLHSLGYHSSTSFAYI